MTTTDFAQINMDRAKGALAAAGLANMRGEFLRTETRAGEFLVWCEAPAKSDGPSFGALNYLYRYRITVCVVSGYGSREHLFDRGLLRAAETIQAVGFVFDTLARAKAAVKKAASSGGDWMVEVTAELDHIEDRDGCCINQGWDTMRQTLDGRPASAPAAVIETWRNR